MPVTYNGFSRQGYMMNEIRECFDQQPVKSAGCRVGKELCMKTKGRKIVSSLLSLLLMVTAIPVSGITASAEEMLIVIDPITFNASDMGMPVSETEAWKISQTLDELKDQSNVYKDPEYEDCYTFYIDPSKTATSENFDFKFYEDPWMCSFVFRRGYNWSVDQFEATLDCSAAKKPNSLNEITIYTYCEVNFDMGYVDGDSYYSLGLDGESYTEEDDYQPPTLYIPYGGTLGEAYNGEFTTLPEITCPDHNASGWYFLVESEDPFHPDQSLKIDPDQTVFTDSVYTVLMTWDLHTHTYPQSNDVNNVIWHWGGTEENNFAGTYVDVYCSDENCPDRDGSKITIRANSETIKKVEITKEETPGSCSTIRTAKYTATASFPPVTGTYTAVKTVQDNAAAGHTWVYDTSNTDAVWTGNDTDGYTKVSVKKTCSNTCHDTDKDGAKEFTVESANIKVETAHGTCGSADETHYIAVFDNKVDPDIKDAFVIEKVVFGQVNDHVWSFDQDLAHAKWYGSDAAGYTAVTIQKKCTNEAHGDETNVVSVTSNKIQKTTEPAGSCGEAAKIKYTVTFDQDADPAITKSFTIEKTVSGKVLEHNWSFDRDPAHVSWTGNDQNGYTKATITKTCKNPEHKNDGETVSVTTDKIRVIKTSVCGKNETVRYIATFDQTTDPAIKQSFTMEKIVTGKLLEHEWVFDTEPSHATWTGNDKDGYQLVTVKKTCNSAYHDTKECGPKEISVSVRPSMSYQEAAACGELTKVTYTAVFDSTADPDIKTPFTFTKVVEGKALPHDWFFDTRSENAVWTEDGNGGYSSVKINKICQNQNHNESINGPKVISVSSNKIEKSIVSACGKADEIRYIATFDSSVDPLILQPFTVEKVVSGQMREHAWVVDTDPEHAIWNGSDEEGYSEVSVCKTCSNPYHTGDQKEMITATVTSSILPGKCGEHKKIVCLAAFDSKLDPAIKEAFTLTKSVEGEEVHHQWEVSSIDSDGDYVKAPQKATIIIKCKNNILEIEAITADHISLLIDNDVERVYQYTGTASDGQEITVSETFFPHEEHNWVFIINWESISPNKEETIVSAMAKCTTGGESIDVSRNVTLKREENSSGTMVTYTATVTYDGKSKTEEKTIEIDSTKINDDVEGVKIFNDGFTIVGLEEKYLYTGANIKPAIQVIDNETNRTLASGTDYTVSYTKNKQIGTATIKIKGKGNYQKTNAEATFKIVDPKQGVNEDDLIDLKGAKIKSLNPNTFEYDGEAHYPETITLQLKGGKIVEYTGTDGENYVDAEGKPLPAVVSFSGNVNQGTATVLLSGKNNSKNKTTIVKKTFKINKVNLSTASAEDLIVIVPENVEWESKGACPEVKVYYKDRELLQYQDYIISYNNNKKSGGTANIKISGKGNYTKNKKNAATYNIVPFDLAQAEIIATTAAEGVKGNKVKVTILDKAGNQIPSSKMKITTTTGGDAEIGNAKLVNGDIITVTATANKPELVNSCSKDVIIGSNLGKAKVKVNLNKTYTGEPIELTEEDMENNITVTLNGKTLVYGADFEIAGYVNNINKGSMTVTIVGTGIDVSGTKTFKVKIDPKVIGNN